MHTYAPSNCPQRVRPDTSRTSGRIPGGVRSMSAKCPLYPTRPDPTRIYLRPCKPLFPARVKAAAFVASLLSCQRNLFPTSQRGTAHNRVSKVTTDRARVTSRWIR